MLKNQDFTKILGMFFFHLSADKGVPGQKTHSKKEDASYDSVLTK